VFKRLLCSLSLLIPAFCQESRTLSIVRGTVVSEEPLIGNHFVVILTESATHTSRGRAYVNGDGGFEFRDIPSGSYSVELAAQNGEPIVQETADLISTGDRIEIKLPEEEKAGGPGRTVSVDQLRHPMSPKAKKLFAEAEKASAAGQYLKAIDLLQGALKDPPAAPYARMNIGVAYLKTNQPAMAVPELQAAVVALPNDAVARNNLAYALLLTRRVDAAEVECRKALQLDANNSKARWVMGAILLAKGTHPEEAVEDLRFASREIPKARVMLAQFYERSGQKDAAAKELRAYLPQASVQERSSVEQWLSKLAPK
jgi:tetratricopeptide (TPR) repeat protein